MKSILRRFTLPLLLGVLAAASGPSLHAEPRLPLSDWKELTLELSPALIVKADLTATVAERTHPNLVERSGTIQPPPGSSVYHLTVETRLKWFLSGKTWLGQLWLQPDLTALQRTRLKSGPTSNYKIYRYAEGGVYRVRQKPKEPEQAQQSPQTWPITSENFYPFPEATARQCEFVSDPYALLLLLTQDWPEDEAHVCLFNKQNVYRVALRRNGRQTIDVDYRRQDSGSRRIKTQIEADRILIHPVPVDPDARDKEPFEFLGMEGDIEFLRDPQTHLPVQIEGEVPGFGQAKLKLTRVKLRPL
ncbi:MAG: hypothetical protein ACPW60_04825 [Methylohalobius sp. ZOD2]